MRKYVAGTLLGATLLLAACGVEFRPLKIGIDLASPLAESVETGANLADKAGIDLEPVLVGSSDDKITMLKSGQIDLAFIHNSVRYTEGVSVLLPVYRDVLHVFKRPDNQADNMVDLLAGKKVYVAGDQSTAHRLLLNARKNTAYAPYDFEITHSRDEDADVLFLMAPLSQDNPQIARLLKEWQLFSLTDPNDLGPGNALEMIHYSMPRMETVLIPAGFYGHEYRAPLVTLGVDMLLVGRSDLASPLIYLMIKALVENKPYFTSLSPIFFEHLGKDPDPDGYNLPLHSGAWRYFNRDEPDFLERYAEVINMGLYALVLVASLAIALLRWRRRLKKNRIDVFYAQLLDVRERNVDGADRSALKAEVRMIEGKAFRMLIDEELVADETMTIFLLQVQNLIRDLETPGS